MPKNNQQKVVSKKINKTKKPITNWYYFDATQQTLGKLAVKVASILQGKHKVDFVRYRLCGDKVVVVNADKIILSGKKAEQKIYRHHTGYIGSLKTKLYKDLLREDSTEVIKRAVFGMLPKNKLRNLMMKNLKVYRLEPAQKLTQEFIKEENNG